MTKTCISLPSRTLHCIVCAHILVTAYHHLDLADMITHSIDFLWLAAIHYTACQKLISNGSSTVIDLKTSTNANTTINTQHGLSQCNLKWYKHWELSRKAQTEGNKLSALAVTCMKMLLYKAAQNSKYPATLYLK